MGLLRKNKVKRDAYIVGRRVYTARVMLGLTQGDVAERVYVSPQAVGAWERGEAFIASDKLVLVSAVLGIDPMLLMDVRDDRDMRSVCLADMHATDQLLSVVGGEARAADAYIEEMMPIDYEVIGAAKVIGDVWQMPKDMLSTLMAWYRTTFDSIWMGVVGDERKTLLDEAARVLDSHGIQKLAEDLACIRLSTAYREIAAAYLSQIVDVDVLDFKADIEKAVVKSNIYA